MIAWLLVYVMLGDGKIDGIKPLASFTTLELCLQARLDVSQHGPNLRQLRCLEIDLREES